MLSTAMDGIAPSSSPDSTWPPSVRARPGAPVATPLWWQELADQSLTPHRFTLRTVGDRLQRLGTSDPWAGMGQRGDSLDRAARRLEELVTHEQ